MTTPTHVRALEHGIHATLAGLRDVATGLDSEDHHEGYKALRATLHVLRDRLPVDEAAQLAAQLPNLLRGVYYEGWDPSRTPTRFHTREQLLDRVAAEGAFHGHTEASYAMAAALTVLRRRISAGELADVAAVLPRDIADLVGGPA
jgi:uncharacterized protein (DUF2267 family)